MRIAILLLTLFITCGLAAQTANVPPRKNKKVMYEGVMKVDSAIKKETLFDRAKDFIDSWYGTTIPIIQYASKDSGKIVIAPALSMQFKRVGINYTGGLWTYIATFDFKDGKYRYRIEGFNNTGFMRGSRFASDLGPIECLYEDEDCWAGINLGNRPTPAERKTILTDVHKEIVKLMAAFDTEMRKPAKDDW